LINEDINVPAFGQTKDNKITTPYAGNGVGMLFPQEESHHLMFAPGGERELGLVGPAYFGADDVVPKRDSAEDFRLQLPGGWCMYITADGLSIIQPSNTDPSGSVGEESSEMQIILDPAVGRIVINRGSDAYIELNEDGKIITNGVETLLQNGSKVLSHGTHVHGYQHMHQAGNMGIPIPPQTHIGPGTDTDQTTDNTVKTKAD
jgi:hypothetical protein